MIQRHTPLKRSTKPLKRTRLARVSKKRAKDMRVYSQLRKECLEQRPICEVWLKENGWACVWNLSQSVAYERTDEHGQHTCRAQTLLEDFRAPPATEIHHRAGRGKNYLNESTWIGVCREAHERIHSNPSWARKLGFII